MASEHTPLFSIITVCYQALPELQRTVASVNASTFKGYEHLIIDGGSSDGTVKWLEGLHDPLLRWESAPDKGLYDAMNKGLARAKGEFVWFVNAGDLIYSEQTMAQLATMVKEEVDILFGEVELKSPLGKVLGTRSELTPHKTPDHLDWRTMRFGMVVSHQAFLPRRRIAPSYIADNLCADIDWVIRCLKVSRSSINTHLILAQFETGGLSRQRHRESLKDRYEVLKLHFGYLPNLFNHIFIILRALWAKMTRSSDRRY
jgi:glycosyltransferase involved in cell wall biosynthesis